MLLLVVHPKRSGRSQSQGPLVTHKLLFEMLSMVYNSTVTPRDQGPGLVLKGVFLATCVFGMLQRKILYYFLSLARPCTLWEVWNTEVSLDVN